MDSTEARTEDLAKYLTHALWRGLRSPKNGFFDIRPNAEDPTWVQLLDRDVRLSWRNAILVSQFDDEAEAARMIERIVRQYRSEDLDMSWYVSPLTKPADFGVLLERAGFRCTETMLGMTANPEEIQVPKEISPRIRVERVTLQSARVFMRLHAKGWNVPEDIARAREEEIVGAYERGEEPSIRFIAYYDDEPAGISAVKRNGSAHHWYGTIVLERFRRLGVYRAMMQARLDFARTERPDRFIVYCLPETSGPICERAGFHVVCEFSIYELA